MNTKLLARQEAPQNANRSVGERRRPGRIDYKSDDLIEVLRDPAGVKAGSAGLQLEADIGSAGTGIDDPLRAARGIATGVILSLGCWIAIGAVIHFLRLD
jgi:hypothetical protein